MEKYDYHYDRVEKSESQEKTSWTPFLRQLLVCSGALTLHFSVGINFGAPTIIIHQIREEANSTDAVSVDTASWLSSIFGYAGLPWAIILATLTHILGRKKTFLLVAFNNIASFIFFYFSVTTTHLLCIAIFQGCSFAINSTTCLLILTELTTPKYRGIFLTMKAASFYWGVWFSNVIGAFSHWRNIPIFGFVTSLYALTAFVWPESPYWLASREKIAECKQAHRWIKGTDKNAEKELQKLITDKPPVFKWSSLNVLLKDVKTKQFYKPTFICIVMLLQFYASGKLVCAVYSMDILKQITSTDKTAKVVMIILDGVSVFSSYIGCVLNGFVKRRTQLFVTSLISIMFLFIMSLYLYLVKLNVLMQNNMLTIVILVIFSIAVSCGPAIMSVSSLGEFIPMKHKILGILIISIWHQGLNSTVLKVFPYVYMAFGLHGTFLCYGIAMTIFTAILFKIMPETKDKTLHEIEEYFAG